MSPTKIVLIGAGSVIFSLRVLQDLFYYRQRLAGSTVVLVDTDHQVLDRIARVALRMNELADADYRFQYTTDRTEALPDAEFVMLTAEIQRVALWQRDWEIPLRHGIRHVQGENAGPGGLSHTLRTIPMVLEICRDIEQLCPDAWVLNLTNPVSRVCLAIARQTRLRFVGLCHQIGEGYYIAAHLLGRVPRAGPWPDNLLKQQEAKQSLEIKAAGLNHFTWILDIRDKTTGRDLYSDLRQAARRAPPDFHPLSRHLLDAFSLMPTGGDDHVGEMIGYASDFTGVRGPDFETLIQRRLDFVQLLESAASTGRADFTPWLSGHSIERVVDFVAAIHCNLNSYELSANILNDGCISNLPGDAIVEVPVVAGGSGVRGLAMGPLPPGIAALCTRQITIQELAVDAALSGSRHLASQALLLDPTVASPKAASALLDDLLTTHAEYLPLFATRAVGDQR